MENQISPSHPLSAAREVNDIENHKPTLIKTDDQKEVAPGLIWNPIG